MMKSLQRLLKADKERYTVPRKVQDVIPIKRIWNDGIFLVGGKYVLISMISALHEGAWTLDEVRGTLQDLFDRSTF